MKKTKIILILLSTLALLLALYNLIINYDHFFKGILEKSFAGIITIFLSYVYVEEMVYAAKKVVRANLYKFIFTILLLSISLCWLVIQYLFEITIDNIYEADSLFNILTSLLALKFYLLIKFSLTQSDIKVLNAALEF